VASAAAVRATASSMPGPGATPDLAARPDVVRVLLVEDDDGDALLVEDLLEMAAAPVELRRAA
jgi:hypothetical protein